MLGIVKNLAYSEVITRRSPWFLQACAYKKKLAPLQERRMIDRFRLWAKGGEGGNGCSSFRRSRHDRRGRPDGGNGGRGGDVILECSPTIWDFSGLQHHNNAKKGGHGAPKNMIGSRGDDKIISVPVGTVIHLIEGEIPSPVQKKSSGALNPWDMPGTLDLGSSKPSPESVREEDRSRNLKKTCTTKDGSVPSRKTIKSDSASPVDNLPHSSSYGDNLESEPGPFNLLNNDYNNEPDYLEIDSEISGSDNPENEPGPFNLLNNDYNNEPDDLETDSEISGSGSDADSEETEEIQYNVAELTEPGQRIIIAHGGDGGLGNVHLGKPSKTGKDSNLDGEASDGEDRASLSSGCPGSEVVLLLELKSIADVGFVGFPSAGKSTLLGAISRAKPQVGHYAFTTLRPNLGNLNYDDLSITVADIPGLISGAHENRGLGHAFLRHIERTKVLAYVLDLAAAIDGRKGIMPWQQLRDLMMELEYYREGLSDRPSLIVANKIDEAGAEEVYEELRERVSGVPIFPVCAVLEEGVPELKTGLKKLVSGEESPRLRLDSIVVD